MLRIPITATGGSKHNKVRTCRRIYQSCCVRRKITKSHEETGGHRTRKSLFLQHHQACNGRELLLNFLEGTGKMCLKKLGNREAVSQRNNLPILCVLGTVGKIGDKGVLILKGHPPRIERQMVCVGGGGILNSMLSWLHGHIMHLNRYCAKGFGS